MYLTSEDTGICSRARDLMRRAIGHVGAVVTARVNRSRKDLSEGSSDPWTRKSYCDVSISVPVLGASGIDGSHSWWVRRNPRRNRRFIRSHEAIGNRIRSGGSDWDEAPDFVY
jgi:hypothetical protein